MCRVQELLLSVTVMYCTVLYSAVQCSAVQCSAVQCGSVQNSARRTVMHCTVLYTVGHSPPGSASKRNQGHGTLPYCTVLYGQLTSRECQLKLTLMMKAARRERKMLNPMARKPEGSGRRGVGGALMLGHIRCEGGGLEVWWGQLLLENRRGLMEGQEAVSL